MLYILILLVIHYREDKRSASVVAVSGVVVCYVVDREKFMKLIGGLQFEKYEDNHEIAA